MWCLLHAVEDAEAIQMRIVIQTRDESLTLTKEWWK